MHPYLLFHSLAEIVSATISFGTFLFAWNTRRFQNGYLITVGAGALFVGLFETLHALAFPGMPIFSSYDANVSPQLWLSARLFQAGASLAGLLLLNRARAVRAPWLLGGFGAAFAALCVGVFLRLLPDVVLKPGGLTTFKVAAEWTLAAAFLGCVPLLIRVRERFSPKVLRLLVAHGATMAACEICFTLYAQPYDLSNFLGHVLLLAGGSLQYLAILRAGLIDPDETHFRDLKRAEQALRDADRSKNEFLATLSHELRNPLAPIKNSLYVLERVPPGGEQARRAQAVIGRQTEQLARLVDDLLDVTRISRNKIRLQRQCLELGDLVRRTVEDHRSLFDGAGVRLELLAAAQPAFVNADGSRLAQVVGNLLQNAAKFTPRGGRVTVSTDAAPTPGRVEIRVADTGIGMAPEVLARLFQPFMQAEATLDRSRGGLGLGLALVKGLIELHEGEIHAHSAGPGKGAEFVVTLPVERAGDVRSGPDHAARAPRPRRVLIIEDDVDAADSLRDLLELAGHEATVAFNGPEGIEKARKLRPDVVLCDVGLPGMDGYEVARTFRADAQLSGARLVALSGYALPEDLRRAADAGFEQHLAKPPRLEKLAELLGSLPGEDRQGTG